MLKRFLAHTQGVYRAFVRNAKFMTPSSAPHVAFMGNCVVELFGLDMGAAYEHAFVYIRELAALLRGALSARTKDAFREVYCWQTVNTLELWAKLLAAHHDKEARRAPPRTSEALQRVAVLCEEALCEAWSGGSV